MPAKRSAAGLVVDPAPLFDLSPHLYMQFMEPLGTTDGSVAAAWDHVRSRWREDLVEVTRELSPALIRWGGCFASYYKWKEGVGPRAERVPMHNLLWGGIETNQVGTHEFVGFCRKVGADPLVVVNFESDGRRHWARPRSVRLLQEGYPAWPGRGMNRAGTAKEAAEWVDYCNSPRSGERVRNGASRPLRVPLWQIGNETSYDERGFDCETAARKTAKFAKAMRKADPSIKLIGWGDSGWAPRMLEVAGEHLDFIAYHNGYCSALRKPEAGRGASPLSDEEFRRDPDRTWAHLMSAWRIGEDKLARMRGEVAGYGVPLALTEGHFNLPGRNRGDVLATWAAGVAYAQLLNLHTRNGDVLKIATLADFCGTRWTVNAVMLPVPGQRNAYMMPVARVMSLFRRHGGKKALRVARVPDGLDVAASRTGDRVWLHVVNTNRTKAVKARVAVEGMGIVSGRAFEIAAEPELEVWWRNARSLAPTERKLRASGRGGGRSGGRSLSWTFPAASVSAVELEVVSSTGRQRGP